MRYILPSQQFSVRGIFLDKPTRTSLKWVLNKWEKKEKMRNKRDICTWGNRDPHWINLAKHKQVVQKNRCKRLVGPFFFSRGLVLFRFHIPLADWRREGCWWDIYWPKKGFIITVTSWREKRGVFFSILWRDRVILPNACQRLPTKANSTYFTPFFGDD